MPRRLVQYSRNEPCYFCGTAPPSTNEHAPPKMLFKDVDCEGITVPSCATHNTGKNGDDAAFVLALCQATTLWQERYGKKLPESTQSAVERIVAGVRRPKQVTKRRFLTDPPEGLDEHNEHIHMDARVPAWIKQLSAALIWSALGGYTHLIDWDRAEVWSPVYHSGSTARPTAQALGDFEGIARFEELVNRQHWHEGWTEEQGYPHTIYQFRICLSDEQLRGLPLTIIKHTFFTWGTWYAFFCGSWRTRKSLQEFLDADPR